MVNPVKLLRAHVRLLGQTRVAELSGVTLSFISGILDGRKKASEKVLKYLGVRKVVTVTYEFTRPQRRPRVGGRDGRRTVDSERGSGRHKAELRQG